MKNKYNCANCLNIQCDLLKGMYFDNIEENSNYVLCISNIMDDYFWNLAYLKTKATDFLIDEIEYRLRKLNRAPALYIGRDDKYYVENKNIIVNKDYKLNDTDVFMILDKYKDVDINIKADLLILAGGDHIYWYNNARYELLDNNLYKNDNQLYMLTKDMSDKYDRDALITSLDRIRENSDNPKWFDGSRAMKVITNLISNRIDAKYIVPTRINMEDGIKTVLDD